MRRWIAVLWQASFLIVAGILYFLFVIPRWHELTGDWSHGLGTAMRIVTGVLVGLAALPVTFTLLKTRKPEYGTPTLALSLRLWSIVLHVLGGVLILGAAISEIWLSLDSAGQWLFGIYGAAAAIALLGALAFYLAFIAEMAPPPPKPLKAKQRTRNRGRRKAATDADATDGADEVEEVGDPDQAEDTSDEVSSEDTVVADAPAGDTVVAEVPGPTGTADITESEVEADAPEDQAGKLRNRRPSGKTTSRLRRRSRGGVAVED
jgi:hypothetical protein